MREQPWILRNPPWNAKMWQVDLRDGQSFDFIGVRNAREIIAEFVVAGSVTSEGSEFSFCAQTCLLETILLR
ncbi:MAG TPA: hypothetical protein VFK05_03985 [Polyangiaceae bacterium]|nr:hypothetical protein [Polyangiaceae bacterium]